jgi:RNA polymerase sigma factor (sigma-70 family)
VEVTGPAHPLSELYRNHHGWLFGLLRNKLGNAFDAADLAHDAFVRLLTKPREFDSFDGARAYLSVVAKGMCVDLWRRRQIEATWLEAVSAWPEDTGISLEQRALIIETLWEVDAILARLPAKAAHAFILAQVHGMTYKEVAAELNVSERMVKKYMAQAMLQFALFEAGLSGVEPMPEHP